MNKRKLGRTDLHVSELGLSTARFGGSDEEAAAFAVLDAYSAAGGSFIQMRAENHSEGFVGCWLESRGVPRDTLVLASRFAFVRPAHGGSIAFANLIREATERSLRRLRTRHLDLLICEWDDPLVPVEDVLEAVDRLIRAGLVRYVVAGGFPSWRVVDALHRACARNHARFEAVQQEYSLMTPAVLEPETLAMCREHRLGFLARSPLARGFLARRSQAEPCQPNGDAVRAALAAIADQRLALPAQIALAWVLRHPQVSSALLSASSAAAVRELVRSAEIVLSNEETGALTGATALPDYRGELRRA